MDRTVLQNYKILLFHRNISLQYMNFIQTIFSEIYTDVDIETKHLNEEEWK